MSVIKRTFPVVFTSFINKCGDIGMYLFPMLLVEKAFSTHEASSVLFFAKSALLVGTFFGGWLSERWGYKGTLIFSLCLAGIGLSLIPISDGFWALGFCAVLTRFGHGVYQAPIRLLTAYAVEKKEQQQESFAWLRTMNNMAQIFGYSLSYIGAAFGLLPFFLFDGLTSFFAAILGLRIVPNIKPHVELPHTIEIKASTRDFFITVVCISGFSFLIDLFVIGTSAYCKIHLGDNGLRVFSAIMVTNTLLCSLLAVVAARRLANPKKVFPLGLLLCGLGILLVLESNASRPLLFLGAFVMTLGEIIFATVAQVELLRVTPKYKNKNSLYSFALVVQSIGRIIGASIAFPVLEAGHLGTFIVIVFTLSLTFVSLLMGRGNSSTTTIKITPKKAV